MTDTATAPADLEPLDDFRERVRQALEANVPKSGNTPPERQGPSDEAELARVAHTRVIQRAFFDAGIAGICVPKEYGGQGLTAAHQQVLNQEIVGYEYPAQTQVPTFTPCMAVILEFGDHDQKSRHIPAILKGEEIWMQFLSEPSGGSDVAGAQTTATKDGDGWLLNGSKIWTTGAWWSDWGLCLARTNSDVPKHRGLSVFMLPIHQPGIELHRIEMLNGSKEFCQEFMTDVWVPDTERVGDIDDGWTVGIRWMYHERTVAGGSQYVTRPSGGGGARSTGPVQTAAHGLISLAEKRGTLEDGRTQELIGEAFSIDMARNALTQRVVKGMQTRHFNDQATSITRLMGGVTGTRSSTISWQIAGSGAVAWNEADNAIGSRGIGFLTRQTGQIAGGTTEMARNVVSERVLGMPRERTADKDIPFRDVPKGPSH